MNDEIVTVNTLGLDEFRHLPLEEYIGKTFRTGRMVTPYAARHIYRVTVYLQKSGFMYDVLSFDDVRPQHKPFAAMLYAVMPNERGVPQVIDGIGEIENYEELGPAIRLYTF